jgi:hypothetical protein
LRIGAGGKKPMSENEVIDLSNFIMSCKNNSQKIYIITLHSYVINKQSVSDVFPSFSINESNEFVLLEDAIFFGKFVLEKRQFCNA